jgi:hypothetical protein
MAKTPKDKDAKKISDKARNAAEKAHRAASQLELELVKFKTGDKSIEFNIDLTAETVWATQADMADLYEVDRSSIGKHLKNILDNNELDRSSVCANFAHTGPDGKNYNVEHYNLDAILFVGFRVNGAKAARFRQWAAKTLRSYIVDGFAINEARLRDDPAATNKLAAKLREIRAGEKTVYAKVRDFFKEASTDYDSSSPKCRTFYATLQDKLHYAITGDTASQIIIKRADHKKDAMGMQSFEGNVPTVTEAQIAKNYLASDELYKLHVLNEQFLLYVEGRALRNMPMTMSQLSDKLDALLTFNEYPVFAGYKDYLKDKAVEHATTEFMLFSVRMRKEDVKKIK